MMPTPIPDSHADLVDQPIVASLSTIGPDGRPQVTALWFVRDGDVIRTSLLASRQKTKNVRAHPHATLFIIDPQNPFRTLEIRGDTDIADDPDLVLMRRVITHYGQDFDTFPAPKDDRVAFTLTPRHVVANG